MDMIPGEQERNCKDCIRNSCDWSGSLNHDASLCEEYQCPKITHDLETKETNPKDAVGIKKAPMSCVSAAVLMEMGLAMMEGARKYGRHNYRASGVRASVYYDAAMRHLMAWWEGEDVDPDSGLSHITKVLSCLSVLRDSQIMGNGVDDRPVRLPNGINTVELNKKAADLIEKYPECVPPYVYDSRPH